MLLLVFKVLDLVVTFTGDEFTVDYLTTTDSGFSDEEPDPWPTDGTTPYY